MSDIHEVFVELGFRNELRRGRAFRALVHRFLRGGYRADNSPSNTDNFRDEERFTNHALDEHPNGALLDIQIADNEIERMTYQFLEVFGHRLWPQSQADRGHLAEYDAGIKFVKGRTFHMLWDGRMAHLALKKYRDRHGWLAKPGAVENRACSSLGKKMQKYFRVVLKGHVTDPGETTETLLAEVLSRDAAAEDEQEGDGMEIDQRPQKRVRFA